jgi:hypothetical protein
MELSDQPKPPVEVSGGKRLNFTRRDMWDDSITSSFTGFGKDESCVPSGSWEELCAMAKLIVDHPAFRLPETVSDYYPPSIEDEETPRASDDKLNDGGSDA